MTGNDDPRAKIAAGRLWAYAGVILGVGVSIAANVAHSYVPPTDEHGKQLFTGDALTNWAPPDGAVFGAVFWPVCLFVVIEIWSRNDWPLSLRSVLIRLGGLLPVGTVAAVVSYLHMSGLLDFYKEDPITVTIGPFAVDGLLVIATGALISTATHAASVRAPEPGSVTVSTSPEAVTELVALPDTAPDSGTTPKPARNTTRRAAKNPTAATTSKTPTTAERVAKLRAKEPDITQVAAAAKLKVTERTVQRYWGPDTEHDTPPGHEHDAAPDNVTPIHKEAQA